MTDKEKSLPLMILRVVLVALGLVSGTVLGQTIYRMVAVSHSFLPDHLAVRIGLSTVVALLFALIGYIISGPILAEMGRVTKFVEVSLKDLPMSGVISGAIGLVVGLAVAALLATAVRSLPLVGSYAPILIAILLGYLGAALGYRWREHMVSLSETIFNGFSTDRRHKKSEKTVSRQDTMRMGAHPKVLDTSVIIDGRIVDIAKCGFLEGPLVISHFVLDELRHIADSSDTLRRNRGRRGLDILNELQTLDVAVEIVETDYPQIEEVDAKLVQLAKDLGGYVVTNDFNLNKVASFQKVRVLNVNELAGSIKTVVLPGEEMRIKIVDRGKGAEQGVGYLDDGTMIVVEGGKDHLGQTVDVVVTSVIQTNAGRMIFVRMED